MCPDDKSIESVIPAEGCWLLLTSSGHLRINHCIIVPEINHKKPPKF